MSYNSRNVARLIELRNALVKAELLENPAIQKILESWVIADGVVTKREFDAKTRKAAAKTGEAMPDGSYPIGNVEDLHNAVGLVGMSSNPKSEVRAHIMRRAKAIGAEKELPAAWSGGVKAKGKK